MRLCLEMSWTIFSYFLHCLKQCNLHQLLYALVISPLCKSNTCKSEPRREKIFELASQRNRGERSKAKLDVSLWFVAMPKMLKTLPDWVGAKDQKRLSSHFLCLLWIVMSVSISLTVNILKAPWRKLHSTMFLCSPIQQSVDCVEMIVVTIFIF